MATPSIPLTSRSAQGDTGHAEVVRLTFDADEISLEEILEIFFHTHDPTTLNRQGNDVGTQYRSGIYYDRPEHGEVANAMIRQMSQDKLFSAHHHRSGAAFELQHGRGLLTRITFANHPHAGYCAFVVGPKVEKFRKTFARYLKD